MQSFSKIIIILITHFFVAQAESQTSFFMEDEDSQRAISIAKQSTEASTKNQNTDLKLSGIFFIDDDNWTVWINDSAYSSIGQQGDFSIDEVSESEVVLTTKDGNSIHLSVNC